MFRTFMKQIIFETNNIYCSSYSSSQLIIYRSYTVKEHKREEAVQDNWKRQQYKIINHKTTEQKEMIVIKMNG